MRTPIPLLLLAALPAAGTAQVLRQAVDKTFTAVPTGAPPIGVRAGTTPITIGLRWGCPDGASGYDVYATGANGVQVKLTPTPIPPQCVQDVSGGVIRSLPGSPGALSLSTAPTYSTGFTHSGLAPQSTYTYVVVALYPNGAQGASPPLAASADPVQPPPLTAAPTPARNVTLSWAAMVGANSYQVHRKLAGQAAFLLVATPGNTTTTWTDGTILPPGQHQYVVQAANGLPSAPMTVTLPPVAAPANLVAQDFLGEARLTWDRVPGATSYHVFRMLVGEPGFTRLTATPIVVFNNTPTQSFPGPEYRDQRMPMAQPVRYYVQAVDGEPSAPVSVMIGIPRWSQVRMFPGNHSVFFNWGGGSGATSERVLRGPTPNGPFMEVKGTQYFKGEGQVPGNPFDTPMYFKVQAVYPTGAAESVMIQVTVKSGPKGETCYGTVSATGAVTWQYYSC